MKVKIERGADFKGILRYALGKEDAELIGGTMSRKTADSLAKEFDVSRSIQPDVKRPVWHASLSLPPGDTLSLVKWEVVATDFMQEMGLGEHQYVVIRHHDTDHEHVHIIASRIGLNGALWLGKWEAKKAIHLTSQLEKRHNLRITKGLETGPASVSAMTRQEAAMGARTGEFPRVILQKAIDAALSSPVSIFEFMNRLEIAGVDVSANVASTGKMNGFSFGYKGIWFKGSDLGKSYGWLGLQKRGVEYAKDRDGQALIARSSREKDTKTSNTTQG